MLFSHGSGQQRINDNNKKAGKLLAIFIAMWMWWYNAGRIA